MTIYIDFNFVEDYLGPKSRESLSSSEKLFLICIQQSTLENVNIVRKIKDLLKYDEYKKVWEKINDEKDEKYNEYREYYYNKIKQDNKKYNEDEIGKKFLLHMFKEVGIIIYDGITWKNIGNFKRKFEIIKNKDEIRIKDLQNLRDNLKFIRIEHIRQTKTPDAAPIKISEFPSLPDIIPFFIEGVIKSHVFKAYMRNPEIKYETIVKGQININLDSYPLIGKQIVSQVVELNEGNLINRYYYSNYSNVISYLEYLVSQGKIEYGFDNRGKFVYKQKLEVFIEKTKNEETIEKWFEEIKTQKIEEIKTDEDVSAVLDKEYKTMIGHTPKEVGLILKICSIREHQRVIRRLYGDVFEKVIEDNKDSIMRKPDSSKKPAYRALYNKLKQSINVLKTNESKTIENNILAIKEATDNAKIDELVRNIWEICNEDPRQPTDEIKEQLKKIVNLPMFYKTKRMLENLIDGKQAKTASLLERTQNQFREELIEKFKDTKGESDLFTPQEETVKFKDKVYFVGGVNLPLSLYYGNKIVNPYDKDDKDFNNYIYDICILDPHFLQEWSLAYKSVDSKIDHISMFGGPQLRKLQKYISEIRSSIFKSMCEAVILGNEEILKDCLDKYNVKIDKDYKDISESRIKKLMQLKTINNIMQTKLAGEMFEGMYILTEEITEDEIKKIEYIQNIDKIYLGNNIAMPSPLGAKSIRDLIKKMPNIDEHNGDKYEYSKDERNLNIIVKVDGNEYVLRTAKHKSMYETIDEVFKHFDQNEIYTCDLTNYDLESIVTILKCLWVYEFITIQKDIGEVNDSLCESFDKFISEKIEKMPKIKGSAELTSTLDNKEIKIEIISQDRGKETEISNKNIKTSKTLMYALIKKTKFYDKVLKKRMDRDGGWFTLTMWALKLLSKLYDSEQDMKYLSYESFKSAYAILLNMAKNGELELNDTIIDRIAKIKKLDNVNSISKISEIKVIEPGLTSTYKPQREVYIPAYQTAAQFADILRAKGHISISIYNKQQSIAVNKQIADIKNTVKKEIGDKKTLQEKINFIKEKMNLIENVKGISKHIMYLIKRKIIKTIINDIFKEDLWGEILKIKQEEFKAWHNIQENTPQTDTEIIKALQGFIDGDAESIDMKSIVGLKGLRFIPDRNDIAEIFMNKLVYLPRKERDGIRINANVLIQGQIKFAEEIIEYISKGHKEIEQEETPFVLKKALNEEIIAEICKNVISGNLKTFIKENKIIMVSRDIKQFVEKNLDNIERGVNEIYKDGKLIENWKGTFKSEDFRTKYQALILLYNAVLKKEERIIPKDTIKTVLSKLKDKLEKFLEEDHKRIHWFEGFVKDELEKNIEFIKDEGDEEINNLIKDFKKQYDDLVEESDDVNAFMLEHGFEKDE